jgi:hypothetical protein
MSFIGMQMFTVHGLDIDNANCGLFSIEHCRSKNIIVAVFVFPCVTTWQFDK